MTLGYLQALAAIAVTSHQFNRADTQDWIAKPSPAG